jgi:hypothetical protein
MYAEVLHGGSGRGVAVPYAALPQLWRLPYSASAEWPFEGTRSCRRCRPLGVAGCGRPVAVRLVLASWFRLVGRALRVLW